MPDATPPSSTARWVQSADEVAELVALIMDPQRTAIVVGVTKQPALDRPLVDADELATRLGDRGTVWVISESAHAWQLTESLPPKIDVYGGAVRAWQPIVDPDAGVYPSDHPQWTVFGAGDADRVLDQVTSYAELAENPPPPFGTEAAGTVTAVRQAGADLELESGHPAFASTSHLVQHGDIWHAGTILTPGQTVQVRVGPWHPQSARVSVSLRDFAPDPWERLAAVYEPGQIVEAGVSAVTDFGAFVELLPGAEGLLHKSKIIDGFVEHVDDFVRPGDRITVRLLSLDPESHKAEVSLLDIPAGAAPEPPASVYPGGPPWLPAPGELVDEEPEAGNGQEGQGERQPEIQRFAPPAPNPDAPITKRFAKALGFMVAYQGHQARKDPAQTPYVAHLMSVAALVLEHGGDEDDAIAGLLHDAIEDAGGKEMEAELAERFGPAVARIVRAVSDTDEDPKPPWRARKEAYIADLAEVDERALRVSAADKLHNARALVADYRRDGDALWERFNAGREDQLWVYGAYVDAFEQRLAALDATDGPTAELVATLRATVAELSAAVAAA